MLQDFKDFIAQGNALDMAVGLILATAFGKIVSTLVSKVLMPPVGKMMGGVSFEDLKYVLQEGVAATGGAAEVAEVAIGYGAFIQSIIDFLIVAFVVFLFVKAYMSANPPPVEEEGPTDIDLLTEIRDALKR